MEVVLKEDAPDSCFLKFSLHLQTKALLLVEIMKGGPDVDALCVSCFAALERLSISSNSSYSHTESSFASPKALRQKCSGCGISGAESRFFWSLCLHPSAICFKVWVFFVHTSCKQKFSFFCKSLPGSLCPSEISD